MHYYKFNISDWGLSTAHLSLEEEAIYFRLINHYYDTESLIPIETQSVFRRLRMGNQEEIALAILGEFFELTEQGWKHKKCESVLKDFRKTTKKNKANGSKGGRPRKDVACSETQDKPSGLPDESQNNPNYELLTKNQELRTKETGPKSNRFVKPSVGEIQEYFTSKLSNPKLEAQKFWNFYDSNGWKVGKNKMQSWRGAAGGWVARNSGNGAAKTEQDFL